jgi:hypothetical protein
MISVEVTDFVDSIIDNTHPENATMSAWSMVLFRGDLSTLLIILKRVQVHRVGSKVQFQIKAGFFSVSRPWQLTSTIVFTSDRIKQTISVTGTKYSYC